MKTGLIIRHTPYEGIAGFRQPVEDAGYHLDRIDVTDPDFMRVNFNTPDLLILMGGPMGVYELTRRCGMSPMCRCCIGMAIRSSFPRGSSGWDRPPLIPIRHFVADRKSSGCNSTPRWGKIPGSMSG